MKLLQIAMKLILILSIPVSLILSNLYILVTENFVRFNYKLIKYKEIDEKWSIVSMILKYIKDPYDRSKLDVEMFTDEEITHYREVRSLILGGLKLGLLSTVILVVSTLVLINEKVKFELLQGYYKVGLIITIGIVITIGFAALVDFDSAFVRFHQTLFIKSQWVFPSNSISIRLFPINFWISVVRTTIFFVLGETMILLFFVSRAKPVKEIFNKVFNQL